MAGLDHALHKRASANGKMPATLTLNKCIDTPRGLI